MFEIALPILMLGQIVDGSLVYATSILRLRQFRMIAATTAAFLSHLKDI